MSVELSRHDSVKGGDSDQHSDVRNIQHSLDSLGCETLLMLNRATTNATIKKTIMPPLIQTLSSLHERSNMSYWGEKFATDFGKSLLVKMLMVDSNVGDTIVGQMETLVSRITTTRGQYQTISPSSNAMNTAETVADTIVLQGMFEVITATSTVGIGTAGGKYQPMVWDRLTKRIVRVVSSCMRMGGGTIDQCTICLMISALTACHALITTTQQQRQQIAENKPSSTLISCCREVVDMCVAVLNEQQSRPGLGVTQRGQRQSNRSSGNDLMVLSKSTICLLAAAVTVCAGNGGRYSLTCLITTLLPYL